VGPPHLKCMGVLNRLKLRNAGAALSDPTGFVLNLKMADT